MNEFIKKLIERLEEVSYNHFDLKLSEAISIVNQLAAEYNKKYEPTMDLIEYGVDGYNLHLKEQYRKGYEDAKAEYNNDVCEWEEDMTLSRSAIAHGKFESLMYVCKWKYCPYCGKKIKVIGQIKEEREG